MIKPYLVYLESRFGQGCRNGMQLWREIKEKGYPGTWRQVLRWLRKRRQQEQLVVQGKADGKSDNAGVLLIPPPNARKMPSPREWT